MFLMDTLRKLMVQKLDANEVDDICFDLGIDKDDLSSTRRAKIRELLLRLHKTNRLSDLRDLLTSDRPDVDWLACWPDTAELAELEITQTHKGIAANFGCTSRLIQVSVSIGLVSLVFATTLYYGYLQSSSNEVPEATRYAETRYAVEATRDAEAVEAPRDAEAVEATRNASQTNIVPPPTITTTSTVTPTLTITPPP